MMSSTLELLTRLLVDVRAAKHGPPIDGRRKRERSSDLNPSSTCRLHNLVADLSRSLWSYALRRRRILSLEAIFVLFSPTEHSEQVFALRSRCTGLVFG
jgi:hypothetical protein